MEAHVSVYVTCPDVDVAKAIARSLIDQRLVACANIMASTSLYRWEGVVQEAPEIVMLLKTRRARLPQIEAVIRALHPHEVPCIVAFDISSGYHPYLAWVDRETTAMTSSR